MTIDKAKEIVENNAKAVNKSLLYYTHEESTFNKNAFWQFYNAVKVLTESSKDNEQIERNMTFRIIKTINYFIRQVSWHFDKGDLYSMSKLPQNINQFSERLSMAVESYVIGNPISDETELVLNKELKNEME